jgi:putative transposase
MKKRFTEEQIIRVLEEGRAGLKVEDLCRKHGISHPTYYNWKTKFANMTISEAKKMRAMESENAKLKRLVAEQQLDIMVLKDIVSKKW